MTQSDSIFGAELDRLKRLLTVGEEESDKDSKEGTPETASLHIITDRPGGQIGQYKLLNVLGEGGMGVVYLAEQKQPIRRQVALKVIKPGMDSKRVVARFEAERQALALLDHPNIAHVYDAGMTESGRPYFVMEYVKGLSITEHCDRHKLTIEDRLNLFRQVCLAVHHAHQKGIIHRDVKPSNILVSLQEDQALPKIIDFGIAKALAQPLTERTLATENSQLLGTPEYMSPEQADMANEDIDTRSDIYSLGVLLYVLLTGVLPFDSTTFREGGLEHIRQVIRETNPKTPSTRLSSLGEEATKVARSRQTEIAALTKKLHKELEWIPLKAMRKNRAERYRSASEMSDDIQNYLSGSPLIAGPETTMYRLSKVIKRNKVPVLAGLTIVFTLITGLAVSIHLYIKAQSALNALNQLESKVEVDDILSTAQGLHTEGRYTEALKELESHLSQSILEPKVYLLQSQILFDMGEQAKARPILEDLTTESPEIAGPARFLLARIALNDDPDQAEQHRQIAESILPKTAEAHTLRAMTAETSEQVLQWLSEAVKLDPSHYPSRKARALAYYGLGDAQNMTEDVTALIALRPGHSLGYALRAIIHRETKKYDQAIADHNHAIELSRIRSELLELYSQRRETYMRAGNYNAALSDARRCTAMDPNESLYAFHVLTALLEKGEYNAAKTLYDQKTRLRFEGELEWYYWYWRSKRWSEQYVFDKLSRGTVLTLPDNVKYKEPFSDMFQATQCYRWLKEHEATKILTTSIGDPKPCWSPDGQQIAGVRFGDVSKLQIVEAEVPSIQGSFGIEVMDIKTRKKRLLTRFGRLPVWSPDGDHIVFENETLRVMYTRNRKTELWIIPAKGGEPRKIANGFRACWSSDSKHIYYQDEQQGSLFRISINELHSSPQLVMEYPVRYKYRNTHYRPNTLKISPNEKYVAYDNFSEVCILYYPSNKTYFDFSIRMPSEYTSLSWSADSRYLFVSLRPHIGQDSIWVLDIEKRQIHHILDHPVRQIVLSPSGSQALLSIKRELWLMNIDPNLPISESLGPAQNWDQYLDQKLRWLEQCLKVEPSIAVNYLLRALVNISRSEYVKARKDLKFCNDLARQFNDPIINWFRWFTYYFVYTDRYEVGELFGEETINMIERFPMSIKTLANSPWDPFRNLIRIYANRKDNSKIQKCLTREGTILAKISLDQQSSSVPSQIHKPGKLRHDKITNSYTITGSGRDIRSVYDQLHFAHKKLNGDGSITIRMDEIQDVDNWTQAGIMIRETLEPYSSRAAIFVTPSGRVVFLYRPEPWSDSVMACTDPNSIVLPHWIKLTRQGNRFIGEHSHNGIQWETFQSDSIPHIMASIEIEMPEEVSIGLAAMSRKGPMVTAEAKISNVQVAGSISPDGPFIESRDIGFPTLETSEN